MTHSLIAQFLFVHIYMSSMKNCGYVGIFLENPKRILPIVKSYLLRVYWVSVQYDESRCEFFVAGIYFCGTFWCSFNQPVFFMLSFKDFLMWLKSEAKVVCSRVEKYLCVFSKFNYFSARDLFVRLKILKKILETIHFLANPFLPPVRCRRSQRYNDKVSIKLKLLQTVTFNIIISAINNREKKSKKRYLWNIVLTDRCLMF